LPDAVHVWVSVPQFPHGRGFIWPGAHWPVHTPDTHVWLVQATPAPHAPAELHVCTPLPEHWTWPGLQATQTPARHAGVVPVQATAPPQLPLESHVSTPLPWHRVFPMTHEPTHMPAEHVLLLHGLGAPHMPREQSCTPLPEHWRLPLVQAPLHTPAVQVLPLHA